MHKKGVMHRDIKPENILIDSLRDDEVSIKLADFGFATYFREKADLMLGSPLYMAPEVINREAYSSKVDIWSAGVVIYIMLSGKPPFIAKTKEAIYKAIKKKEVEFPDSEWANISAEAKDFMKKALVKDPNQRTNIDNLLNHPWLQID
jgi:serine/threonine protein kinase